MQAVDRMQAVDMQILVSSKFSAANSVDRHRTRAQSKCAGQLHG